MFVCPDKTRSDLEWDRLLDALASRASSRPGRAALLALPFLDTEADVRQALGEVREAMELAVTGDPLPVPPLESAAPLAARAQKGELLTPVELRQVLSLVAAVRVLAAFARRRAERCPLLARALRAEHEPSLALLEGRIAPALAEGDALSDQASPALGELRGRVRTLRERVVRKIQEALGQYEGALADRFWTQREGRYVLPVRSDALERVPGIVHGASASGATLFVEPRSVVDLANQHRVAEVAVHREEERILAELSALVGEHADAVVRGEETLVRADSRGASGRFALELELGFPDVGRPERGRPSLDLPRARHPLLALAGVPVVPSHLVLEPGRALVVSGPNAGGKTVALKTAGLAALLVRAGLPVPASAGAFVALFDRVSSDVGDEQSLVKNLSTFSAHVVNLAAVLADATAETLVVGDELASGTDPREGEALAGAVLEALANRGATVAVTTHYEGLKARALTDARFVNASVGFELATMRPTFVVTLGVPGPSSALAVARRFGIDERVIGRAEELLSREDASFAELVAKLEEARRHAEHDRRALEAERAAVAREREELLAGRAALRDRQTSALDKEGQALLAAVRKARDELKRAEGQLRAGAGGGDKREAAAVVAELGAMTALGAPLEAELHKLRAREPEQPLVGELRVGQRVFVPKLRAEADVVELLSGRRARVAAGSLKLVVEVSELRAPAPREKPRDPKKPKRGGLLFDAAADPDVPIQTAENTVDVRGLRSHEAVSMAEQFLDRAMGEGRRVAFVIHGLGTCALRDAVRGELGSGGYVARFRPGREGEGGDGVTVFWLKG
jgi:DNA mismatch repair protein MutS2